MSTSGSVLDDATPRMSGDIAAETSAFVAAARYPRGRGQAAQRPSEDDDVMAFSQGAMGSMEFENAHGEEEGEVGAEEDKDWHTPHSLVDRKSVV